MKQRMAIAAAVAVITGGIIWILRSQVFIWFDKATNFKALISQSGSAISPDDSVRELTDLSGREAIWIAALKVMVYNPRIFFFGISPACASSALQQIGGIKFQVAHAHNIILQFGICFGVPAMIAFLAFLVSIAIKCVRILCSLNDIHFKAAYTIPVTILMLVVLNLAEAYLVAYFSIMSCVFFLFCGWANALGRKKTL